MNIEYENPGVPHLRSQVIAAFYYYFNKKNFNSDILKMVLESAHAAHYLFKFSPDDCLYYIIMCEKEQKDILLTLLQTDKNLCKRFASFFTSEVLNSQILSAKQFQGQDVTFSQSILYLLAESDPAIFKIILVRKSQSREAHHC